MRLTLLATACCVALVGCQSFGNRHTAAASDNPRLTSLPTPTTVHSPIVESGEASRDVQLVQHAEPIPVPDSQGEAVPPVHGVLTLGDLEQMAIAANPSVARAAALVRAARGNWIQAGLPPNPTIGYEGQQIGSAGRAEQDGVFIEQEIVRGGKLKLSRNVAAHEWVRREQELAAQQQRVLTDVRVAYYQVLVAERQKELTGELLKIANEAAKVANDLLRGKEVGRTDVVQAQLEIGNAEILAQNAQNRYIAAWRGLATVIGEPNMPPQEVVGDLDEDRPEVSWEESRERLVTSSPEIAAAMSDIERSRWALQRALAARTPNVTVAGLVNWRDNGIGGASDGAVTVGVPLPLWNRNQGEIVQAQGEIAAAERALDQLELSLENRLAPVFERYSNALNQVKKYRDQLLPAARQSLDLVRRLYQAGETPYLNLLTAQRSFSQTNVNYLESLRELRAAEAEIDGLLLSGSLENRQ